MRPGMRLALKLVILPFFLSLQILHAQPVKFSPSVNYEFTSGSDDYYSNSGGAGVLLKFPNRSRFSANYSLSTDSDYSLIHSGTLRLKAGPDPRFDFNAGITFSGGKLKDSDASTSLTSFELEATRYISDTLESSIEYRYADGSISTRINRPIVIGRGRRTETRIIEEDFVSKYTAHTFSASGGYQFNDSRLFGALRLAVSFYSDRANLYTEGLELSHPLPYKFSIGFSYMLTQSAESVNRSYISFFISKLF